MKKKIFLDTLASLIAANALATYTDYYWLGQKFEIEILYALLVFFVSFFSFLGFLISLRKQENTTTLIGNSLDYVFIAYLLFLVVGLGLAFWKLGDIYDKNFGKRLLDLIDNEAVRNFLDIYATASNSNIILTHFGLLLLLLLTVFPRVLAAWLKKNPTRSM
ncbi:MAG: hypothetical protein SFU27_14630 [Thermonemataceae bacterium]|nr:hypothetical protein [Thermonemataceae bacterium]